MIGVQPGGSAGLSASLTLEDITIDGGHNGTLAEPDPATKVTQPIIYLISSSQASYLTVGTGTVLENNYNTYAGEIAPAGGAIVVSGANATVNIAGGTIRNNYSYAGGAIYFPSGGVLNMTSGSITGNQAGGSGGGAIQSWNATLNITGGTIADNTVSGTGVGSAILRENNNQIINIGSGTSISGIVQLKTAQPTNPTLAKATFAINSPLINSIAYASSGNGREDELVAQAAIGYTLTAADAAKFVWGGSGEWYFKLDGNQIRLTATPPSPTVGAPGSGDLDGDGTVTAAEAVLVAHYIVSGGALTPAQILAADMDGDNVLTMVDVILLMRKSVGL
jgi:hypothetical protein